ncbi:uncharacterized protein [Mytilus edulis]|uniref:uncharacterized protein n=1 Tax=Mytilus edulis TaxID=6550 RepID=UPI0039F052E0
MKLLVQLFLCFVVVQANGRYVTKWKKNKKTGIPKHLITFNTGLATFLQFYDQRRNHIDDAILHADPDIICLNEIWYAEDLVLIQKSLRRKFPYSFSKIHNDDTILLNQQQLKKHPCNPVNFQKVLKCFLSYCNALDSADEHIECLILRCEAARSLSNDCLACLIVSGFNRSVQQCVSSTPEKQIGTINGPGLALFSKYPMTQRKAQSLIPGIQKPFSRWLLSAKVKGIGKIGCTHLPSAIASRYIDPVSPPLFSTYKEENLNNTLRILEFFKAENKYILLGDLNQSPRVQATNITPEFEDNYKQFLSSGLSNPYVDAVGLPTYGIVNSLSRNRSGNYILDHIVHKGFHVKSTRRVFDRFIDVDGQNIPLSDHYGVSVTFQTKKCA